MLALLPNPLPPHIPGGEIVTDPGLGVFCDNAMDLPLDEWPHPTRADKIEFAKDAMKSLHAAGIVGVHDAGVLPEDVEMYDWYVPPVLSLTCHYRGRADWNGYVGWQIQGF